MAKKKKYDSENGVWRTVGGRRIFIRNGQDLSSAMKESGKFNNSSNKTFERKYDSVEDRYNKDEDFRDMLKEEHEKTLKATRGEINSYFDLEYRDKEIGSKDDLYKMINDNYYNVGKEDFDKIYSEEATARYNKVDKEWQELSKKMEKDYNEFGTTNWKDEKKLNELSAKRDRLSIYNDEVEKQKTSDLMKEMGVRTFADEIKDKEIESSIKSLFIYKDEKGMGSLEEDPLKRYYDKYGKENVDRVWKQMDKKYDVIKGTSIDSEGLTYNNLVEKDKYSPEAIQKYKNATKRAWENYYGDSRKYNEEVGRAREEFERSKKSDYDHFAGWELYNDGPNRFGDKLRKYNNKMNPSKNEALNKVKNKRVVENVKSGDRFYEVGNGQWRSEKDGYDYYLDFNSSNIDNPKYRDVASGRIINTNPRAENYWDYEGDGLKSKYKGTIDYLRKTTNMNGIEILELLRRIDEDKK